MQDNDDSLPDEKEVGAFLNSEKEKLEKTLSENRRFHDNNLNDRLKQYLDFNTKLGELSLLVAAALAPVIIASGTTKLNNTQQIFLFFSLGLYLLNGIYAITRAKYIVERQLEAYALGNLHRIELTVYPIIFNINKLEFEPTNNEYLQEFYSSRKKFLEDNIELNLPSTRVDFSLDIIVAIFTIATLLLINLIWPFSILYYWIYSFLILVIILILVIYGGLQTKKNAVRNRDYTSKLNALKREHIEWQKCKKII